MSLRIPRDGVAMMILILFIVTGMALMFDGTTQGNATLAPGRSDDCKPACAKEGFSCCAPGFGKGTHASKHDRPLQQAECWKECTSSTGKGMTVTSGSTTTSKTSDVDLALTEVEVVNGQMSVKIKNVGKTTLGGKKRSSATLTQKLERIGATQKQLQEDARLNTKNIIAFNPDRILRATETIASFDLFGKGQAPIANKNYLYTAELTHPDDANTANNRIQAKVMIRSDTRVFLEKV